MNDRDLHKQLTTPPIPKDLEKKIHENWKQQLTPVEKAYTAFAWRAAYVSSACLFVVALAFSSLSFSTPSLVTAAYHDIQKDRPLEIGISIPNEVWLQTHHINMPPASMAIEMTKYCYIERHKTVHLQIAGAKQGKVHLFIQQGEFDQSFWHKSTGNFKSMPWRLLAPRTDLSVLAFYTPDMNPDNVEKLINTMFFT